MASANLKEFADQTFDNDVVKSPTPVLVDFTATWCAPCRALAPHVEALAQQFQGKLTVGKLDIDQNPEAPSRYGIRGVPTLLLFKGGQVVDQIVGAVPKTRIEQMISKHLG